MIYLSITAFKRLRCFLLPGVSGADAAVCFACLGLASPTSPFAVFQRFWVARQRRRVRATKCHEIAAIVRIVTVITSIERISRFIRPGPGTRLQAVLENREVAGTHLCFPPAFFASLAPIGGLTALGFLFVTSVLRLLSPFLSSLGLVLVGSTYDVPDDALLRKGVRHLQGCDISGEHYGT